MQDEHSFAGRPASHQLYGKRARLPVESGVIDDGLVVAPLTQETQRGAVGFLFGAAP